MGWLVWSTMAQTQCERRMAMLIWAVVLCAALTGCSGTNQSSSSTRSTAAQSLVTEMAWSLRPGPVPAQPPASTQIVISNSAYSVNYSVHYPWASPGQPVAIINNDGPAHTVTSDAANLFDVQVKGGGTGTFNAPVTPGVYPFHCKYHASMHGQLEVASWSP